MRMYCVDCEKEVEVEIIRPKNAEGKYAICKCPHCGNCTYVEEMYINSENAPGNFLVDGKTRKLRSVAYNMLLFDMPDTSGGFYVQAAYDIFSDEISKYKEKENILFKSIKCSNYEGLQAFIKFLSDEKNIKKMKAVWRASVEYHELRWQLAQEEYWRRRNSRRRKWYDYEGICEEIQFEYLDPTLYY